MVWRCRVDFFVVVFVLGVVKVRLGLRCLYSFLLISDPEDRRASIIHKMELDTPKSL